MKRVIFFAIMVIVGDLFADDMSLTLPYIDNRSGFTFGIMPKNMPDKEGYKGSETTIAPVFSSLRLCYKDMLFHLVLPIVVNPDDTKKDIMLNTILIDAGYVYGINGAKIYSGVQITPALNIGSNARNDLQNNLSIFSSVYYDITSTLNIALRLQYYQSLSDKSVYSGLYLTRANTGFSTEARVEYYFPQERLSTILEALLFRDLSNGVSNIYLNPGIRFLIDELDTVYVTLSIPVYDDKFKERYQSGINLYYDRRF